MKETAIQPVRGMPDIYGSAFLKHLHIIQTAYDQAGLYGYEGIATPLVEPIDVFKRSIGSETDIVSKEMYTLTDRNEAVLCLRPEGTAGVMRALLSNKLTHELPHKFFYAGPMFRYERPQKGRFRQFHQIGVEFLGEENPLSDVETIALGATVLQKLGVSAALEINTLGDTESRMAYKKDLCTYLERYASSLSADSQRRLTTNPLRILDSKAPEDQEIIKNAPIVTDCLTAEAAQRFSDVQAELQHLAIPFTVNPYLVRGLDYYCHTAFEFKNHTLGAQSTVLAGGRYDGLAQTLGGPSIPAVGWAAGIERLALLLPDPLPSAPLCIVIPLSAQEKSCAFQILENLRKSNIKALFSFKPALKAGFKTAEKMKASFAIFIGETEVQQQHATVKNLNTGTQMQVSFESLATTLKAIQ